MSKRKVFIYWFFTIWLSLGMLSTGIVQVIQMEEEVIRITQLGYPAYLLIILGISKLLGVIAVLIPKFPLLKEWAYAGFLFTIAGAIISHLVMGEAIGYPLLFLVLIAGSWYFRPSERKVAVRHKTSGASHTATLSSGK